MISLSVLHYAWAGFRHGVALEASLSQYCYFLIVYWLEEHRALARRRWYLMNDVSSLTL